MLERESSNESSVSFTKQQVKHAQRFAISVTEAILAKFLQALRMTQHPKSIFLIAATAFPTFRNEWIFSMAGHYG